MESSQMTPIFIFSLPRSGSTLLQKVLSSHPDIDTFAEPWILLPLVGTYKNLETKSIYQYDWATQAIQDMIAHLPLGEQSYQESIRIFVSSVYNSLGKAKFFIDKTPRYYLIIDEIKRIFPDAKFIFLTRNLISTYSSFMGTWYYGTLIKEPSHYYDLKEGPKMLYEGYVRNEKNSLKISYEEFVQDPAAVLESISQYLGIENRFSLDVDKKNFSGNMGDKTGGLEYNTISVGSAEKSEKYIDSIFIIKYINRYLDNYSSELLHFFNTRKISRKVYKVGVVSAIDASISSILRRTDIWRYLVKIKNKYK